MQTIFPTIAVPQYSASFFCFGALLPVRVFIFQCILTWLMPRIISHVSPVHVPHLLPEIWLKVPGNGSAWGRIQVLMLLSRQNGPCSTFQVPAGDLKACPWTRIQNNQWHEFKRLLHTANDFVSRYLPLSIPRFRTSSSSLHLDQPKLISIPSELLQRRRRGSPARWSLTGIIFA